LEVVFVELVCALAFIKLLMIRTNPRKVYLIFILVECSMENG